MFLVMFVWVYVGGLLLLKSVKKRDYPKRITLSRCILILLFAGAGGSIGGIVFFFLIKNVGVYMDANLKILGGLVGAVVMIIVAFFVIYAMLELSFTKSLKAALVPLGVQVILLGIVGPACLIPAYYMRKADVKQDRCREQLAMIGQALATYQRNYERPALTFKDLVEKNVLPANRLKCPAVKDKEIGYFYYPARIIKRQDASKQLLVCDFRGNHPAGRNTLTVNNLFRWYDEDDFEVVLSLPENKEFAAALRAAESK